MIVKNGKRVPHAWNMVNIDGQPYNYFKVNKRTFWMKSQAMAYVEKDLQGGDTEFYFRIVGSNAASDVAEKIYDQIYALFSEKGLTDKRVKHIANEKIGTCWIKIC